MANLILKTPVGQLVESCYVPMVIPNELGNHFGSLKIPCKIKYMPTSWPWNLTCKHLPRWNEIYDYIKTCKWMLIH